MSVKKIVLTGGPCAGKTTAEKVLINELEKSGYKVFFIPETATEILEKGVNPGTLGGGNEGLYLFQKSIFELQQAKEEVFEQMAERYPAEKKVIIYDRGLVDGKGFGGKEIYDRILYEENKNEFAIRDHYDGVFHLVTAARGAEKFYSKESNENRQEDLEGARVADKALVEAWSGHPHLRIIGNNGRDFSSKMAELVKSVKAFLGEPVPKEIEYKYLIEYPDVNKLLQIPTCQKSTITQIYLKNPPGSPNGMDRRIRQREQGGHITYTYTEKTPVKGGNGFVRMEDERHITASEYNSLLKETDYNKHTIIKDRYSIVDGERTYEIDVYPFWDDRAIMEVELEDEGDIVEIPDFVNVVRNVTNEPEYKNSSLAVNFDIYEPELEGEER